MYVTRPLSLYREFPETLARLPEGPNSGILVIQDEELETTTCFGLCKDRQIRNLPIPQNKAITIRYSSGSGENKHVSYEHVMIIPVLNQPLSSNQYYVTAVRGKHRGEAYTSSKEEDKGTCCCCTFYRDAKSRPFNRHDIYQQFEFIQREPICGTSSTGFYAKSVASDGIPPYVLRRKGWKVIAETPKNYEVGEALGIDATLRARLPDFNFPLSRIHSEPLVVGKWYCPYIFIKDGELKEESKKSPYYKMTLEQRWEQIFTCEKNYGDRNVVTVDVIIQTEVALVNGKKVLPKETNTINGEVMWLGGEHGVGLDLEIIERMKWEEERVGWINGSNGQAKVKRVEEYGDIGEWTKFGCYILVERFVLKRMDGSLVLAYDFNHSHQVNVKWE